MFQQGPGLLWITQISSLLLTQMLNILLFALPIKMMTSLLLHFDLLLKKATCLIVIMQLLKQM